MHTGQTPVNEMQYYMFNTNNNLENNCLSNTCIVLMGSRVFLMPNPLFKMY